MTAPHTFRDHFEAGRPPNSSKQESKALFSLLG